MIEIVPAIIAKDNRELNRKIGLIRQHCSRVQLDIMDGRFVAQKTVLPARIKLQHRIGIEFHLMVMQPEKYLQDCFRLKPKKIIFHFGSTKKPDEVISAIRKRNIKVGIAINPEIKISQIKQLIPKVDFVQLMTVHPGKYGAKFLPSVLKKIDEIRKIRKIPVEVDGGMNKDTVCLAVQQHASIAGVGSAIFKARNSEKSLLEIRQFAKSC